MVTVWNYIKHKGPNSCDSKWSLTFFPPDTTSSLCLTHAAPIQTIFFAAKLSYLTGFLFSSGSLAVTIPTCVPTLVSSFTSIIAPSGGWKIGGSSMSDTLTRTMVWSRKEPRSTKRGSTCLFTASTTTLCVRLLSKSSVWRNKEDSVLMSQQYMRNDTRLSTDTDAQVSVYTHLGGVDGFSRLLWCLQDQVITSGL